MRRILMPPSIMAALLVATAGCDTLPLLSNVHEHQMRGNATMPVDGVFTNPLDPIQEMYALTVGDLLEIKFPYRADLSETVSIREDGMIALPLIEPVMAAGKTPTELQAELVEAYKALEYKPVEESDEDKEYRIQVNDVLEIRFDNQPQFNDSVIVRPDGKISLGLVKTVEAEGKTPEELEKELTEKYAKYIKTPDLVVIVRQFSGDKYYVDGKPKRPGLRNLEGLTVIVRSVQPRQVYVTGEVKTAGPVPYIYPMTAYQAIMSAGGVPRSGKLNDVVLLRRVNHAEPISVSLNLRPDKLGVATNDVPLRPGDTLYVQKTPIAKVNDFIQQYFYDLVPMAKNSTFNMIYQIGLPRTNIEQPLNPQGQ